MRAEKSHHKRGTLKKRNAQKPFFVAGLLLALVLGVAVSGSQKNAFTSAEVHFADSSPGGLQIMPASCASSVSHFMGACSLPSTCEITINGTQFATITDGQVSTIQLQWAAPRPAASYDVSGIDAEGSIDTIGAVYPTGTLNPPAPHASKTYTYSGYYVDALGTSIAGSDFTCQAQLTVNNPPTNQLYINKVELSKHVNNFVAPGDLIKYRMYIENQSASQTQTNLTVTDAIPQNTTLAWQGGGMDSSSNSAAGSTGNVWWANLQSGTPPGWSGYLDMHVRVNSNAPNGASICNTATIASDQWSGTNARNSNPAVCDTVAVPTGSISISPNPIQVCSTDPNAVATVTVNATSNYNFSVYVKAPSDATWTQFSDSVGGTTLTRQTGNWVRNGMVFSLVRDQGGATLDTVTAQFTQNGCLSPDLTAGAVTPTTAIAGIAKTFSATITNQGTGTASTPFKNFAQYTTAVNGSNIATGVVTDLGVTSPTTISSLAAGASTPVTFSRTFPSPGTYYLRVCADNDWSGGAGYNGEGSNEGNNCGPWTPIAVSASPTNGACSSPAAHYACLTGTSVNNVDGTSSWTWSCNGSNGGTNASCSEAKTSVTNGACSSPAAHYACLTGTSVNNVDGATSWTWGCNGSNGGTNASCSEAKTTSPTNPTPTPSCPAPGTLATISWEGSPGATTYYPRVVVPAGASCSSGWTMWSDGRTCMWDNAPGDTRQATFATTPGASYTTYIFAGNPVDWNSNPIQVPFTCQASATNPTADLRITAINGVANPTQYQYDSTVNAGDTVTIAWSSTNGISANATLTGTDGLSSNPWNGWTAANRTSGTDFSGTKTTSAFVAANQGFNYTYTYTVQGGSGTSPASKGAVVRVRSASPSGNSFSASCSTITGTVQSTSQSNKSVYLYDGPRTGIGTQNSIYTANGTPGVVGPQTFSLNTPESLKDGVSHSLYMYTNSGGSTYSMFPDSPHSITCSAPTCPPGYTGTYPNCVEPPQSISCSSNPASGTYSAPQSVTFTATGGNSYSFVNGNGNLLTSSENGVWTTTYNYACDSNNVDCTPRGSGGSYIVKVFASGQTAANAVNCGSFLITGASKAPDLTAGLVTPTTATMGVVTTLSALIKNIGSLGAAPPVGTPTFPNLFEINPDSIPTLFENIQYKIAGTPIYNLTSGQPTAWVYQSPQNNFPVSGGGTYALYIMGSGFGSTNTVRIDTGFDIHDISNVPVTKVFSSEFLVVPVPKSIGSEASVTVTNDDSQLSAAVAGTVYIPTYVPSQPVITGLSNYSPYPGETVTIYGSGFSTTNSNVITFLTTSQVSGSASAVAGSGGTTLTFTVPNLQPARQYSIRVQNVGSGREVLTGAPILSVRYSGLPMNGSISSISPLSGPSGTSVTITGTGFVSDAMLTFGNLQFMPVTISGGGTIATFTIPPGIWGADQPVLISLSGDPNADPRSYAYAYFKPTYSAQVPGESYSSKAVTAPFTFTTAGTWYVRACADANTQNTGVVTESNEGNNCSPNWTEVTVTGSTCTPSCSCSGNTLNCTLADCSTTSNLCSYQCSQSQRACIPPPTMSGDISAQPPLVGYGGTAMISWNAQNVNNCKVTGTNGDGGGVWNTPGGGSKSVDDSHLSSPITAPTTYTLSCNGVDNTDASSFLPVDSVTVGIIPSFREL